MTRVKHPLTLIPLSLILTHTLYGSPCSSGEYLEQGTTICRSGTAVTSIFDLPTCAEDQRLQQGTSVCNSATAVTTDDTWIPSCPEGERSIQGTTTQCVETNQVPFADAGEDRNVTLGDTITITGSGSDNDGSVVAYEWREDSTLLASTESFDFTPSTAGVHVLRLTVTDDDGATGSDIMEVNVTSETNIPPVADAGSDASVPFDQTIRLNGSGSDDDGSIESYEWKEGSTVLSDSASFDYTPGITGVHELTLTVTDDDGAQGTDTVKITATKEQPLLIIRIEFNDYQFRDGADVWADKIFGEGEQKLNDYFDEVSYGVFKFIPVDETDGTADGIVTVHLDEDHPGNVDDFIDRIVTAAELSDEFVDYAAYDTDGNDELSRREIQVMFLVAGGESATGASPGIWAHSWCMYGGNADAPILDGVSVMDCYADGRYARFGEKHFDADTGDNASIGIIAHELGHSVFALPDLYDTDGSSEGIGNFGLMGAGSWGYKQGENPGVTPVHMTGWSKVYSNFITPKTIGTTSNLEVQATTSADYELLKIDTNVTGEYFLIENRAAQGYELGLYSINRGSGDPYEGGLCIMHIDDNQDDNKDEDHKMVDVEEANNPGLDDGSHRGDYANLYYSGNSSEFSETTDPNSDTYANGASGISIKNISERGDVMTLDLEKN